MGRGNFDSRQTEHRSKLNRLSAQDTPTLKTVLPNLNTELTPVFALTESATPDLILNVGPAVIQNTDTGITRSFSPINRKYFQFTGGTITFPSANGVIGVTPGDDSSISVSNDTFIAVLVQIDSDGQLVVINGTEAATAALAINADNFPAPVSTNLSIGYVVLENVAGTFQVIENDSITQFQAGGGSGGSGGGGLDVFFSEDFEGVAAADATTGNDAIFLNGGSIAGSVTDEEVNQLKGDRSIRYTQASGSLNDYFAFEDIPVALKEKGQFASASIYSINDHNDNEMDLVIYDSTNSDVVARIGLKQSADALKHEVFFNIPLTCDNLRYGLQTMTENVGATVLIDDIQIQINPLPVIETFRRDPWVEFTNELIVSPGFGTISNQKAYFKRDGQHLHAKIAFTTGSVSASRASIRLPNSLAIDLLPLQDDLNDEIGRYHNAQINVAENSGGNVAGAITLQSSFSVNDILLAGNMVANGSGRIFREDLCSDIIASNSEVSVYFVIPIAGWNDTAQSVAIKNSVTPSSFENTFAFSVDAAGNKDGDTLGIINTSKIASGRYQCTYTSNVSFSEIPVVQAQCVESGRNYDVRNQTLSGFQVLLQDPTGSTNFDTDFNITIERKGDDRISEVDRIYTVPVSTLTGNSVRAESNAGTAITANTTDIDWITVADDASAWNGTQYTVQDDDSIISISLAARFSTATEYAINLYRNNTLYKRIKQNPTNILISADYVSGRGEFAKDDILSFRIDQSQTLVPGGDNSFLTINEEYGDKGMFLGTLGQPVAYVADEKPSGTSAGAFNSGSWQTRTLTTVTGDLSILSLNTSTNQITLQPGTYTVDGWGSAEDTNVHQTRIQDITNGVTLIPGESAFNQPTVGGSALNAPSTSKVDGIFSITTETIIELQHQASTNGTFGRAVAFGINEIFARLKITKVR